MQRKSNIELFRILLMLSIIAHHFVVNSGLLGRMSHNLESINNIFLWLFGMWGKIAINCFVLITGYFMSKSQFTWKKFVKLIVEIEFYKIFIYLIFVIAGKEIISAKRLFEVLSPIIDLTTEFVSGFLVMFLFIPFLNIIIQHIDRQKHLSFISLSLLFFTIWDQFPGVIVPLGYSTWFFVLYLIGAYLRNYQIRNKFTRIILDSKMGTILMLLMASGSVIIMLLLRQCELITWWPLHWVVDCNAPLAVLTSISLFNFFRKLNVKDNRFINTISASTFGVLLIHASSETMRTFLWYDIFDCESWYLSPWLPLYSVMVVILVYICCTIIDMFRIHFFEKLVINIKKY